MGNFGIAFFAGLGVTIWAYSKFSKRASGGDFKKTAIAAGVSGVFASIIAFIIMTTFLS
jgi:hypothetical protein